MGVNTLNGYFYKPDYGASGVVEKGLFDDKLNIADAQIEENKDLSHSQGKDQGLDSGGPNAVIVADLKDSVTKKHTQNTDTDLEAVFKATLAKKLDKLSVFAATSSAELAGVISDETGSDKLVYNTSPVLVTPTLGAAAATSINLTGGQIKFPAVNIPSADVNTLDDYEEGDWTPDLRFDTLKVGITYQVDIGQYIKIGRLIYLDFYIILSSKGSSVGYAGIYGVPFVPSINGGSTSMIYHNNITIATWENRIDADTSIIYLNKVSGAGVILITNTEFTNNTVLRGSCVFSV